MPAVSSILQSLIISFLFFPSVTIWILHMGGYKMIERAKHSHLHTINEEDQKEDIRMRLGGWMVEIEKDQTGGYLKIKHHRNKNYKI